MPSTPSLLETAGILVVQTRDGLAFRPCADVALATEECEGRLTIVFSDGMVAHRPGPLEESPVRGPVTVDEGVLAARLHGRTQGAVVRFPGGWTFPSTRLPRSRVASPATSSVSMNVDGSDIDLSLLRSFQAEKTKYRLAFEGGTTLVISCGAAKDFVARLRLVLRPVNTSALRKTQHSGGGPIGLRPWGNQGFRRGTG